MTDLVISDPLRAYEAALEALSLHSSDLSAQHQAVLALARMGSLDFALAEYDRLGLDKIRNHEDVQALGARLLKDLYQRGAALYTLRYARKSAKKYQQAFDDSQGYYSGVNAATMALLSDAPYADIVTQADAVLSLLPAPDDLSPEEHYFIEATRAECLLLKGKISSAKDILRQAVAFDPLNYLAHASTLRQFRLIIKKQSGDQNWLSALTPPRPIHFAGHLWDDDIQIDQDLPTQLADIIQEYDIGFGYGALAAGADILIAEALLREGAELNVILPEPVDQFVERSVRPYGTGWIARFETCVDQAKSILSLPRLRPGQSQAQTVLAAHMAMGKAILRGDQLGSDPQQLLIQDLGRTSSMTTRLKADWIETDRVSHSVPQSLPRTSTPNTMPDADMLRLCLMRIGDDHVDTYDDIDNALRAANIASEARVALHYHLSGADAELRTILRATRSPGLFVSEAVAMEIALNRRESYEVIFAGLAKSDSGSVRIYQLQSKKR